VAELKAVGPVLIAVWNAMKEKWMFKEHAMKKSACNKVKYSAKNQEAVR
jgi:hypothetical protein